MRSPLLFGVALLLAGCGGGGGGGGTAKPVTVVLKADPSLDGYVYANPLRAPDTTHDVAVGDTLDDVGVRGFMSFDVTGIPPGAAILSADLTLYRHTPYGSASDLGPLLVDEVVYGDTLDPGAYGRAYPVNQGLGVLGTNGFGPQTVAVTAAVQDAIDNGDARSQLRLRFSVETNSNGTTDGFTFRSADTATSPSEEPVLEVTYLPR